MTGDHCCESKAVAQAREDCGPDFNRYLAMFSIAMPKGLTGTLECEVVTVSNQELKQAT